MINAFKSNFILKEPFFDFAYYDIPDQAAQVADTSNRSILVVLKEEDYNAQETLLLKILSAVGVDADKDVLFVKLKDGDYGPISHYDHPALNKVIAFGLKPTELGYNASFKGYRFYKTESYSLLLSHSLVALADSQEKKKALWEALQKAFAKA